ncbi:Alanyl-tRNA synthetase [Hordeum vulgare]|nr:Alanyl-tRNA synthetase [Hordeum vulgare]
MSLSDLPTTTAATTTAFPATSQQPPPPHHSPLPLTLPGHGWRPPDQGTIKINNDGNVASQHSRGGGRGVARSEHAFIAVWCKPFGGVTDPLVAEALALREGVRFARVRGFSRVVLETDSLELVQLWHLRDNSRSVVAPIMDEIGENVAFFLLFVFSIVIVQLTRLPTCVQNMLALER